MKTTAITGLFGAAMLLGACASRPPPPSQDRPVREAPRAVMSADALLFVAMDADRDGRLTRAELDAAIAPEFRAATDGAGTLSPLQFEAWSLRALGGPEIGPYRLEFDRNADGAITAVEFKTALETRFSEYDRANKGFVSRADLVRVLPQAQMRGGGQRPSRQGPEGGGPPGGPGGGRRPQ